MLTPSPGQGLLDRARISVRRGRIPCAGGLFRRGVLVAGTYSKARTIRIEPPLGIPMAMLQEMLNRLEDTLEEIARSGVRLKRVAGG